MNTSSHELRTQKGRKNDGGRPDVDFPRVFVEEPDILNPHEAATGAGDREEAVQDP